MNYELRIKNFSAKDGKTLNPKPSTLHAQKGFTLVEMIVALGMFTTVMLIVISVLASVSSANEKARTLRVVIDNLNFAVENMARTLRVGSVYHCGDGGGTVQQDCSAGESEITFKNIQGGDSDENDERTTFRLNDADEEACADITKACFIEYAENCPNGVCPAEGEQWLRLTAPEIDVDGLTFYVLGSEEDDGRQAQVLIIAKGTAGKGNIRTEFNIQTTVTQRLTDS